MTATLNPSSEQTLWGTMPGWGIVADLTPHELVQSRKLRTLRKVIAAVLLLVVALCAAGYAYAFLKHRSASHDLDAARSRTSQLAAERQKYANVTKIQSATASITAEINALTATNVDAAMLLADVRDALPNSMSLTSLTISINGAAAGTNTAPSLDTSGHAVVGSVTLAGTSQRLVDLAGYVTALSGLRGVANVVPTTNSTGTAGTAQWNVTLQLTNALYTRPTSTGGN